MQVISRYEARLPMNRHVRAGRQSHAVNNLCVKPPPSVNPVTFQNPKITGIQKSNLQMWSDQKPCLHIQNNCLIIRNTLLVNELNKIHFRYQLFYLISINLFAISEWIFGSKWIRWENNLTHMFTPSTLKSETLKTSIWKSFYNSVITLLMGLHWCFCFSKWGNCGNYWNLAGWNYYLTKFNITMLL